MARDEGTKVKVTQGDKGVENRKVGETKSQEAESLRNDQFQQWGWGWVDSARISMG